MKIKIYFSFFLCFIFSFSVAGQSELIGAWEGEIQDPDNHVVKVAIIFTENYQSTAIYNNTGELIATHGGSWKLDGNTLTSDLEFDSMDADPKQNKTIIEFSGDTLKMPRDGITLKRVDDGTPGKLVGAWLFYSRNIPGSEFSREADNPRKTMKILSGSRFQWIAYDTESGEIFGSGGGKYRTENGKYIEEIEFFAKDPTRTGIELEFNFDLKDNEWRHSGLSTKGDPIDETWKRRD